MTARFDTIRDVIDQVIVPSIGVEHADDFDLDGIAREAFAYVVDRDADGNERLDTARYVQACDAETFWDVVARHERGQADDGGTA